MRRTFGLWTALLLLIAGSVQAAPFGGWLHLTGNTVSGGPGHGYIQIPHNPSLNPTSAITLELWVRLATPFPTQSCRSLIGKGWTQAYWVGVCGSELRSYVQGYPNTYLSQGNVPANVWTHLAVVYDGVHHTHYINGVKVGEVAQTGALTTDTQPVRIGSDISWEYSPVGDLDEIRLWSVARSQAQILSTMDTALSLPQPGLVAVWSLDGKSDATVGGFSGSLTGAASFVAPPPPAGGWLTTPELPGFQVKVKVGGSLTGAEVASCVTETLCVSGAVPGRAEVFVRIVGPKPNGYLWPTIIKLNTSTVEVWIQKIDTGQIQYYYLNGSSADSGLLPGLFDANGFLP